MGFSVGAVADGMALGATHEGRRYIRSLSVAVLIRIAIGGVP